MEKDSETKDRSVLLKERKMPSKVEAGIKFILLFFLINFVFWLFVVFALS